MTGLEDAFVAHEEFDRDGDAFAVTTAQFDARVHPGGSEWHVVCEVPTLDAVVAGETVGDAVSAGWFETLERRLAAVDGVTDRAEATPPDVDRDGDAVVVESTLTGPAGSAAEDARAVVTFVEGTWFEGVVPGYDYVDRVAEMRSRAHRQGGTPR